MRFIHVLKQSSLMRFTDVLKQPSLVRLRSTSERAYTRSTVGRIEPWLEGFSTYISFQPFESKPHLARIRLYTISQLQKNNSAFNFFGKFSTMESLRQMSYPNRDQRVQALGSISMITSIDAWPGKL